MTTLTHRLAKLEERQIAVTPAKLVRLLTEAEAQACGSEAPDGEMWIVLVAVEPPARYADGSLMVAA